ncbi:ABC transporter permease [Rhodococcus sp. ABRD24]|uniref:galactan export ABC transporter permease subunit Wzm/RfbD n=1 Tax=Rhodococcus sp. ABRD24 TaxID=2507582 RepID=UPI00103F653E|nr:ABC transporter permease [Rhodococcus sp. ABRD24]QBJ96747.1 ABC transporter permease [Rhodococcus sp. ABRD24]
MSAAALDPEPASDADTDSHVSDSQTFRRAFKDLRDGFAQRELWLNLGWQDIKQRYRRSVIGPFWITIATGVQATAIGILYAALLDIPIQEFLPYVTVGLIVWNMISASILEGSEVFIANEGLIKQLPSALSVHIYRLVWRQLLLFAHNLLIYVIMLLAFGVWRHLTWPDLAAIPALGLIVLNALWVSIVFGIFATRYRDIAPILQSLTLLLFVLTPIMWTTQSLEAQGPEVAKRAKIAEINPLFHFLDIVRAPMIGQDQQAYHWYIVLAFTVVGWTVAILALRKYRARVAYWV